MAWWIVSSGGSGEQPWRASATSCLARWPGGWAADFEGVYGACALWIDDAVVVHWQLLWTVAIRVSVGFVARDCLPFKAALLSHVGYSQRFSEALDPLAVRADGPV